MKHLKKKGKKEKQFGIVCTYSLEFIKMYR